ncbi:hypothetical protein NE590_14965 [Blautia obeum]|uniref:hypothetical protein n=1 Tax=Blautia obeum TaxID=40520 RepID=UPI00210B9E96|nr:hypothetical protein [Blautia obeum]MCQ4791124.1 hypothetical protein [Blautia obeum]
MEKEQKIDRSLIYAKALAMVKVINNTDSMLRDIGLTMLLQRSQQANSITAT